MERIKIIGKLDLKREQDSRIYETSGLAPTLRAENHDVKILVGITINMDILIQKEISLFHVNLILQIIFIGITRIIKPSKHELLKSVLIRF